LVTPSPTLPCTQGIDLPAGAGAGEQYLAGSLRLAGAGECLAVGGKRVGGLDGGGDGAVLDQPGQFGVGGLDLRPRGITNPVTTTKTPSDGEPSAMQGLTHLGRRNFGLGGGVFEDLDHLFSEQLGNV
jgi:hypothetical protein